MFWLYLAVVVGAVGFGYGLAVLRKNLRQRRLDLARKTFHQRREWLEARFITLASQTGKPRGLRWAECDFDDAVEFGRDRGTGDVRAFTAIHIKFAAIEGGGMEDVEAVNNHKAATAVFRFDGREWSTDGRAVLNLNPTETIARFHHEQVS